MTDANVVSPPPESEEARLAAVGAKLEADYAAWWAERKARGRALQQNSRQVWAAMEGWGAVRTQEDWERLRGEVVEGWASGQALIEMLGGERYLAPERAALVLHLWRHFVAAYELDSPAEFLVLTMAILSFAHFVRLNEFVGNLEMRLEDEFFATAGLQAKYEERYGRGARVRGLRVEEIAAQLGRDALPLLDRLNRMVIRNLRALRDLKTTPLALNVQNFGQMNVGQVQTNVSQPPNGQPATTTAPIEAEAEVKPKRRKSGN